MQRGLLNFPKLHSKVVFQDGLYFMELDLEIKMSFQLLLQPLSRVDHSPLHIQLSDKVGNFGASGLLVGVLGDEPFKVAPILAGISDDVTNHLLGDPVLLGDGLLGFKVHQCQMGDPNLVLNCQRSLLGASPPKADRSTLHLKLPGISGVIVSFTKIALFHPLDMRGDKMNVDVEGTGHCFIEFNRIFAQLKSMSSDVHSHFPKLLTIQSTIRKLKIWV